MNFADWYTDRVDIYRVRNLPDGALTRQARVKIAEDVPCRVYRSSRHGPRMQATAAYSESADDKLACASEVDIHAGDELRVHRGKGLGQTRQVIRAFAGEPAYYYEPFGAVLPGLAHQEVAFLEKEYLDAEKEAEEDGNGGCPPEADGGADQASGGA